MKHGSSSESMIDSFSNHAGLTRMATEMPKPARLHDVFNDAAKRGVSIGRFKISRERARRPRRLNSGRPAKGTITPARLSRHSSGGGKAAPRHLAQSAHRFSTGRY